MNTIDITLNLPAELVIRAKEAGVLTAERVVAWLENELERQYRARRLLETIDKLQSIKSALTQAEVDEEIRAYRAEKLRCVS